MNWIWQGRCQSIKKVWWWTLSHLAHMNLTIHTQSPKVFILSLFLEVSCVTNFFYYRFYLIISYGWLVLIVFVKLSIYLFVFANKGLFFWTKTFIDSSAIYTTWNKHVYKAKYQGKQLISVNACNSLFIYYKIYSWLVCKRYFINSFFVM